MHSRCFLHRDIKADIFIIGLGRKANQYKDLQTHKRRSTSTRYQATGSDLVSSSTCQDNMETGEGDGNVHEQVVDVVFFQTLL
ncbi:hypothetical protein Tco_0964789 [Tanacetum coccineum]